MKKCDIVMKGGITSGIVYPGVVVKLAEEYEFQSIGGTSAGGIAAALTAAAEFSRKKRQDVFGELAKIPIWLGADSAQAAGSNLFNLFQSQPGTRGLFRIATAFLIPGWVKRLGIISRVLWLEILSGLLPGVVLGYLASQQPGWRFAAALVLGFVAALSGVLLAALVGILLRVRRLPSRHYGFCTGYIRRKSARQPISLVEWLNERLNTFAGMPAGQPLTFGDLKKSGITLKMITTCLTFGRPFSLPFGSNEFYFCPSELRQYFPDEVIKWMEDHPPTADTHGEKINLNGLKPLPDQEHLPVILAVRLSLSFPILFCAVPLYAVDFTRRRRGADEPPPAERVPGDAIGHDELRQPERVWFADGGITSNFPFHLFDCPLPRWPTFGLDLEDLRADRNQDASRTWMPKSNVSGIASSWTRLDTSPSLQSAGAFAFSMIDAARNWMDNLQATVPGYRDRIVHVYLSKQEGGLNLNMPHKVVTALSGYGEQAAERLIDHFIRGTDDGNPTPMTWDNQRWIRCRSTMALLERFIGDYVNALKNPEQGDSDILTLINRGDHDPPDSYRFSAQQRVDASEMTDELTELGDRMAGKDLSNGAPKPTPALRVRPAF